MLCMLLAASVWAAKKDLPFVKDSKTAVEIARTRGKMILLTVIVDGDPENRIVPEDVFRDAGFKKISSEFVLLYANNDWKHGQVKRKSKSGKSVSRCADCPSIRCEDHVMLAQQYARGFYPTADARTPIHFVIDKNEDVVEMIYVGDFEMGFNHVPPKQLVGRLKKILDKHGKGLSEKQFEQMMAHLSDAKAARARKNVTLELEKLLKVVTLERDVEGVEQARKRVAEIDTVAAGELKKVEALVGETKWEEALDALGKIEKTYPGAPTAILAEKRRKELLKQKDVKKILKLRDVFQKALEYKERGKLDLARKKLEQCVRQGKGTPYAERAQAELARIEDG